MITPTGAAIGGWIKDTGTSITTYCNQASAKEDLVSDQAIASNLGACKVQVDHDVRDRAKTEAKLARVSALKT